VSHVFLLRHGLTVSYGCYCGSTDVALREEGWRQLWAAVDGYAWQRILSSPLRRCADFAAARRRERSSWMPRARVLPLWQELVTGNAADRVLMVRHGGPMRILWAKIISQPPTRLLEIEVSYAALWDTRALRSATTQ
jgi:broad specificity phosphatase PhoE